MSDMKRRIVLADLTRFRWVEVYSIANPNGFLPVPGQIAMFNMPDHERGVDSFDCWYDSDESTPELGITGRVIASERDMLTISVSNRTGAFRDINRMYMLVEIPAETQGYEPRIPDMVPVMSPYYRPAAPHPTSISSDRATQIFKRLRWLPTAKSTAYDPMQGIVWGQYISYADRNREVTYGGPRHNHVAHFTPINSPAPGFRMDSFGIARFSDNHASQVEDVFEGVYDGRPRWTNRRALYYTGSSGTYPVVFKHDQAGVVLDTLSSWLSHMLGSEEEATLKKAAAEEAARLAKLRAQATQSELKEALKEAIEFCRTMPAQRAAFVVPRLNDVSINLAHVISNYPDMLRVFERK